MGNPLRFFQLVESLKLDGLQIVLLGYMGCGKSAVGEELAKVLGWPFHDLDSLIEKDQGMPVSRIFSELGEIFFRKREAALLRETLDTNDPVVLSLGGGTPCYARNMDFLRARSNLKTVYLKTSLSTLEERLWPQRSSRPLIAHLEDRDELNDFIRKHLFERAPFYLQAEWMIETDNRSPREVAENIVSRLF